MFALALGRLLRMARFVVLTVYRGRGAGKSSVPFNLRLDADVRVEWEGPKVIAEIERICDEVLRETALDIQADAIRILQQKTKKPTGKLAGDIKFSQSKYEDGGYIVAARGDSRRPYAAQVELGTDKTEAKPFLRPALKANKRKFLRKFRNRLK